MLTAPAEEIAERRKIIKNKILAVGKMSRVFAVLREESEAVSELKNVSSTDRLPSGALANGAEGIKEAISGFGDARRADIENERLPPDLVDASEVEGFEEFSTSNPTSPRQSADLSSFGILGAPLTLGGSSGSIAAAAGQQSPSLNGSPGGGGPMTPDRTASPGSTGSMEPSTPATPGGSSFRRGHSRNSSLGTTSTSCVGSARGEADAAARLRVAGRSNRRSSRSAMCSRASPTRPSRPWRIASPRRPRRRHRPSADSCSSGFVFACPLHSSKLYSCIHDPIVSRYDPARDDPVGPEELGPQPLETRWTREWLGLSALLADQLRPRRDDEQVDERTWAGEQRRCEPDAALDHEPLDAEPSECRQCRDEVDPTCVISAEPGARRT